MFFISSSTLLPSSAFLLSWLKKTEYFSFSKFDVAFSGYFLGLPRPLFICPSNVSGCFVFIWLFKAGLLKNDLPQSHLNIRPSGSCFERRCLPIFIKIFNLLIYCYDYLRELVELDWGLGGCYLLGVLLCIELNL